MSLSCILVYSIELVLHNDCCDFAYTADLSSLERGEEAEWEKACIMNFIMCYKERNIDGRAGPHHCTALKPLQ